MVAVVSSGVTSNVVGTVLEDVLVLGTVRVTSAGTIAGGEVTSRGYIALSSGIASDLTLSRLGQLDVAISGGASIAQNNTVLSGGIITVWKNGSSVSNVISSGGSLYLGRRGSTIQGGVSLDDTVRAGGTMSVANQGSATRTNISAGGKVIVDYQGVSTSAAILQGGTALVSSGGTAYDTLVRSGGILSNYGVISAGNDTLRGITSGTQVFAGGTAIIGNGGIGYNEVAEDGGSIIVGAYGSAFVSGIETGNYLVTSQGRVWVQDHAVLSNATVQTYGVVTVAGEGAAVIGADVSGVFGTIEVSSGGVVSDAHLRASGTILASVGGSSVSAVVSSGGRVSAVSGGVSINDTMLSGGTLTVRNGGTGVMPAVSAGGRAIVDTSGVVTSAAVRDGGTAIVGSGGTMLTAVVSNGGVLINSGRAGLSAGAVDSRGITSGTLVLSGGSALINSGGLSYNDTAEDGGVVSVNANGSAYISNFDATNYAVTSQGRVYVGENASLTGVEITTYGVVNASGANAVVSDAHVTGVFGMISAQAGAVVSQAEIGNSGSVLLDSGGTSISSVITSGGTIWAGRRNTSVASGLSLNDTVMSGGRLIVENYGSAFKPIIANGGMLSATTTGVVTSALVQGGGLMYVGSSNNTSDPAHSFNTYIASGGTEIIGVGAVENGATIGSGGTVVINDAGGLVSGRLEEHGTIDFNYLSGTITSANLTSDGLLTVRASNGRTASIQLAGTYTHNEFAFTGDTLTLLCFLAGTAIRTPHGEKSVEDLQIGDHVCVWDWKNGVERTSRLRWVGRQRVEIDPTLSDDQAGYPVCIRADAVAPGIPARDLYVTPEHCLFFDGVFIPARMLVNGRSIYYDKTRADHFVYHVETQEHSVLWAEAMLTESYLDTGNRRNFHQHGSVVQFGADHAHDWAHDAAAPLDSTRARVEPVYQRLLERAGVTAESPETTFDTAMELVATDGRVFPPLRISGDKHVFMLEGDVRHLTLRSNASRPCDAIGPFVDDRRKLGVLVGRITIFSNAQMREVEKHITSETLEGWLCRDGHHCRWTNGEARLPLTLHADEGPHLIAIEIVAGGPYLMEQPERVAPYLSEEKMRLLV